MANSPVSIDRFRVDFATPSRTYRRFSRPSQAAWFALCRDTVRHRAPDDTSTSGQPDAPNIKIHNLSTTESQRFVSNVKALAPPPEIGSWISKTTLVAIRLIPRWPTTVIVRATVDPRVSADWLRLEPKGEWAEEIVSEVVFLLERRPEGFRYERLFLGGYHLAHMLETFFGQYPLAVSIDVLGIECPVYDGGEVRTVRPLPDG